MSVCHVCGNSGIENYDDTNAQGHLCTGSRPCTRCARRAHRHELISELVAVGAFLFAIGLAFWGGMPR